MIRHLLTAAALTTLAACASNGGEVDQRTGTAASPYASQAAPEPHRKVGKRYKVAGRWYTPRHDPSYDERGTASWYGPKFHGRLTANGEVFDMNRLTAAHPTLPLPSLVRVTNLNNGSQVVLRVNDRGPFAHDRVIDLSRAAAETLGTRAAGLAPVRVEYLGEAPMSEAIVALGEPEAYADGRYAGVASPGPRAGDVASTVRTRIEEGEELPASLSADRVAAAPAPAVLAAAAAERAVTTVPVAPARPFPPARPYRASAPISVVREAPSSIPDGPATNARFFVQVGAFASFDNAAAASARLPSAVPISLTTDDDQARPLHRLRIGPYAHEFPAAEALRVAQAAGFDGAVLVED